MWIRNRYEVTVTQNLFKSQPWEKQANNQSNCKIEFPASGEAGSALLQSLVAPVAPRTTASLFSNPQITIRSRKEPKRKFLRERNGLFLRGIVGREF